jgi:hypothetical protein
MAEIGLFVDLNLERVEKSSDVQHVRERILQRFSGNPHARVDIYRMTSLRSHEEVNPSDMLVAHVPGSQLSGCTIENIIKSNQEQEQTIRDLNLEISELREKFRHSDTIRQEALSTVDLLRSEFMNLLEEVTNRRDSHVTTSSRLREPYEHASSARRSQRLKLIPRLGLSNLRH